MVNFRFSAFADEYSSCFDEQIKGLLLNNVRMIEVRGVDGKNISDLTLCEAKAIAEKLKAAGIGVSAIGSPIGKIEITDDRILHKRALLLVAELEEAPVYIPVTCINDRLAPCVSAPRYKDLLIVIVDLPFEKIGHAVLVKQLVAHGTTKEGRCVGQDDRFAITDNAIGNGVQRLQEKPREIIA